MSKYTPTTGHIQDAWTSRQEEFSRTTQEEYDELVAEFDRWLASYEAELREKIAVKLSKAQIPLIGNGADYWINDFNDGLAAAIEIVRKGGSDE